MEIVCKDCKKPFNANPLEVASASVNFSLGRKHVFYCDHCKAENPLTREEFEDIKEGKPAAAAPKPVVSSGVKPAAAPAAAAPKPQPKPVAAAPAPKPVAPKPAVHSEAMEARDAKPSAPQPKEGSVVVRSLRVRKDHNTSAEVVAGLSHGDKVKVLSTWTDGKNTWAEIGPGQWAAIEHNGEKMIEIS